MTFTGHTYSSKGSQGTYNAAGPQYDAHYRLTSNDALDQAQLAIAYVQANIADLGAAYSYGNDSNQNARLDLIDPKLIEDSGDGEYYWECRLHYAIPTETTDDGGVPSDPLDLRPEVSVQTAQYTKACESAKYIQGFVGATANAIAGGYTGPIINSAFVAYDPPPEVEDGRKIVRVRRNVRVIDATDVDAGIVNKQSFVIDYRGLRLKVGKLRAMTRDIDIQMRRTNGVDYLAASFALDVIESDDKNDNWRIRVIDRGLTALAGPGDPNGRGNTFSQTNMIAGVPQQRRLVDQDDMPVSEPVLLDGAGQPIVIGNAAPTPVVTEWKYYREANYKKWPAFAGILK